MNWKVEQIPELTGYTVEWAETDNFYLSRHNRIYYSTSLAPPFKEVGRVDAPFWKSLAAYSRLGQRLLRYLVYNVIPLANGDVFITFDKTVGIIRDAKYQTLDGLIRPCRVLRAGCAVDRIGNVFFGEYLANNERGPMRIYIYVPGSDALEVAYTFSAGSIRHIHGLYFDKYTDSIFCLTGDADSECQILRTSDGFATTEFVGHGDESWRAVSILFEKDNFYYGTDAEFRDNQIFRVDRSTIERTTLGDVSGTVFYSKKIGKDLFFTTTAENSPSQKENIAALWHINADGECNRLASFEKDGWHGGLFMFGTIHFPYLNTLDNKLFFNLVGVKGDNETFCVRRTREIA
ncbi:MAG: hypothetical protein ABIO36_07150 [Pyrinomonadaceae bacterium]